jgi:hypothetical protein
MTDMSAPSDRPDEPTREQVIEALLALKERGFNNPDDLPRDDPEVIAAEALLNQWDANETERARQSSDPSVAAAHGLSRTIIYVDAGYTDPIYLDAVANDWLVNSLSDAEIAGLDDIADRIKDKILEIQALIERVTTPTRRELFLSVIAAELPEDDRDWLLKYAETVDDDDLLSALITALINAGHDYEDILRQYGFRVSESPPGSS